MRTYAGEAMIDEAREIRLWLVCSCANSRVFMLTCAMHG